MIDFKDLGQIDLINWEKKIDIDFKEKRISLPSLVRFSDVEKLADAIIKKYNITKDDIYIYEVNYCEGETQIVFK
jgi:hypothetical protein